MLCFHIPFFGMHLKVEVCAKITVSSILHKKSDDKQSSLGFRETYSRTNGFEVTLKTEVTQVRDGVTIADGQHLIWVPDFLHDSN
jgi:hypothetical protein